MAAIVCYMIPLILQLQFALALTNLSSVAEPDAPPRGVVLIISDDQAWTDFGFMGHEDIRTPHLDRLAAEGTCFRRGYVPSSLCRPSLLSIISGRYPHEHGITGNDPLPGNDRSRMLSRIAAVDTLPELLAQRGYQSLQTGKWWEGSPENAGFTRWMTHGDPKRGGRHGDKGLSIGRDGVQPIASFLDDCVRDEDPFFIWYAPFLPHRPHNPPAEYLERYRAPDRPEPIAKYMAMCAWFDQTCGDVLGLLEERGLSDDTLIAFVTDNGWIQRPNASGYAARSKRSPYEGGIRTPILLRWPAKIPPSTKDQPVSSVDLAPTILRACGIDVPTEMTGNDLIAMANGEEPERSAVFGATFEHDQDIDDPTRLLTHRFVIDGDMKLIEPGDAAQSPELFDLSRDPHETNDLASEDPVRVMTLSDKLDAWWKPAPPPRPNFLFVITDDQRADALGAAGHPFLQTPTMDRLAHEGVRFENAFVTTPICAASRASLLTGMHESRHGYTFGTPPISTAHTDVSYPTVLRSAGYRTAFFGKWGVKTEAGATDAMWDVFRPMGQPYFRKRPQPHDGETSHPPHLTDRTASAAIEFLEGAPDDQPFSLTICFNAPHADDGSPFQYIWPRRQNGLYDGVPIPLQPTSEPEFFAALPEFQRDSMSRDRWFWRFDTEQKRQRMTRGYYRMITGIDYALGQIIEALGDRAENTVVIFTSDNGYFLGERGFAGKWTGHEPSLRVPLIVFDPRQPAKSRERVNSEMALNIDLPATILDLAGLPVPAEVAGKSLAPLLASKASDIPWRDDFFFEHRFNNSRIPKSEGVRGSQFAYARYYEQTPVHEELYDLENDPHQTTNLALEAEYGPVLEEIRARCETLKTEASNSTNQNAR